METSKNTYEAPQLELLSMQVEYGFAASQSEQNEHMPDQAVTW